MKPDFPEKGMETDPNGDGIADSSATMKFARFEPGDLRDPGAVSEALAHWDELDPVTLRTLAADPRHRSRLNLLQSVDVWMQSRVHDADASSVARDCPTAEELYDFGRGPGFSSLAAARREAIEGHAASCAECSEIVLSLATPPPLPLVLGPWLEPVIDRPVARRPTAAPAPLSRPELVGPRRPLPATKRPSFDELWKRWAPVAAAAGVLVAASVWFGSQRESASGRFPESPLLRGEAGGPLYFPRDRVLVANANLAQAWPALADELKFEIEPQPEAVAYRVDLFRHEAGAFAPAEPVESLSSEGPSLSLPARALPPGNYTWRAWVLERGLERSLGERDFALVEDAGLARELERLAGLAEPERSLAAVRLLVERGYSTDARRLARRLPQSPERDAFLGRMPGR